LMLSIAREDLQPPRHRADARVLTPSSRSSQGEPVGNGGVHDPAAHNRATAPPRGRL
jgi:hypothetical protein